MREKNMYFIVLIIALAGLWFSFRAEASEVTVGASPDPYQVIWDNATDEDIRMLTCVVWYESALSDCPLETNVAVVETILNRCLSEAFPSTISEVVRQRGQFYYRDTKIDSTDVSEAIKHVQQNGRTVLPDYDYCYFATKRQSLGKDHLWVGRRKANGKVWKTKGMYFCRGK